MNLGNTGKKQRVLSSVLDKSLIPVNNDLATISNDFEPLLQDNMRPISTFYGPDNISRPMLIRSSHTNSKTEILNTIKDMHDELRMSKYIF